MVKLGVATRSVLKRAVAKWPWPDLILRNAFLSRRYGSRLLRILQRRPPSELRFKKDGARLTVPWASVPAYFPQHEPGSVRWLAKRLSPGSVAIDVGAHIGYFTVLMARLVGRQGRVYAVEPAQDNLSFLHRNVKQNRLDNVTVVPCAAGRDSTVRALRLGTNSDGYGFYTPLKETIRTVPTAQVRLDELVQGPVDLIKIDVEGAEFEVLEGTANLLRHNPNLSLIVEWSPLCLSQAGYGAHELPDYLRKKGFAPFVVDDVSHGSRSVEEVLELLDSGSLHLFWYCNLICEGRANSEAL
jgi:FkbM family methyltransferase